MKIPTERSYYDIGDISVIDVIKAKLTTEQYEGFCLGSIIKYALRLNHKGAKDADIEKMADYAAWLNEYIVKENENAN